MGPGSKPASLPSLTIAPEASIRDAMMALDRGAREIVLAVDGGGVLVGIATDGDLRRALLGGAGLGDPALPHLKRHFSAVGPEAGRPEVLELMQARRIGQVPIVDAAGRLVGIHFLHDILVPSPRSNWAVVMAGGRGARLGPLTDNVPKPMLRVAGRPILERIVLQLVSAGVHRVFLAINYLGHLIEEHFGDGARFGCRVEYLREERPLGTGGPLSLLPEPPTEPLLVMNGDLITQANLAGMLDAHAHEGWRATIGVRRYAHTVPFGCVEVTGGRITTLEEKPTLERLVNAGIYVLDPALVARVPRDRELPITTLLDEALRRGEPLGAFEILDDWIDVGQRDELRRARGGGEP